MTTTYDEVKLIMIPELFNIVKSYYYNDNMYPFLEEVRNYSFYDLSQVEFKEMYRYDLSKENRLLNQYFRIGKMADELKEYKKSSQIYNTKKEIIICEARSYNYKLKELHLYADIDNVLRYINIDMGEGWNWNDIEECDRDTYIFSLKPITIN